MKNQIIPNDLVEDGIEKTRKNLPGEMTGQTDMDVITEEIMISRQKEIGMAEIGTGETTEMIPEKPDGIETGNERETGETIEETEHMTEKDTMTEIKPEIEMTKPAAITIEDQDQDQVIHHLTCLTTEDKGEAQSKKKVQLDKLRRKDGP